MGRELRLALGMRGGVSLAVWIGGACAEIDHLRRGQVGGWWARLREATGYDSVIVDVMAGASAGGLNGSLYAASQVYDFPYDSIRDIWREVGGTDQLVRTDVTERASADNDLRWISLFRGDGHFFTSVAEHLSGLITGPSLGVRPRVDLWLSATHVEPVERPVVSPSDEQLTEARFPTGFRFRHPAYVWQPTDFDPWAPHDAPGHAAFVNQVSRLALAARATSSYPAAFEAAWITSSRRQSFTSAPAPAATGEVDIEVDMGGILADRSTGSPFVVADGGIVDNIPLGRALDAVAAAPADGPTDRYLVYLHPGAPTEPADGTADTVTAARRRSVVRVLRATVGARLMSEDIAGDIDQIRRHNDGVARAVAVRRATFESLTNRADLIAHADRSLTSYRIQRAAEDARMVSSLLSDPVGILEHDPFPATVGGETVTDEQWRSPLAGWSLDAQERIHAELAQAMLDRELRSADEAVFATGAHPLERVTQTLLQWSRFLEDQAIEEASDVKEALYRVLEFWDAAIERPRRAAWVALFATAPRNEAANEVVGTAFARLGHLTRIPPDDADALSRALLDGDDEGIEAGCAAAWERVEQAVAGAWDELAPTPADNMIDLRCAVASDIITPLADQLRQAAGDAVFDVAEGLGQRDPGGYLHRVLRGDEVSVATLAALEVACYAEHATGLPCRSPVRFVRLSAANPTPIAAAFTALISAAEQRGLWWDREQQTPEEQRGVHLQLKLAGVELANFSAFLREEWRANDWMWGRMDAVPTLVELTVTADSLRTIPDEKRLATIEALVVSDASPQVAPLCEQLWKAYQPAVNFELVALAEAPPGEPVDLRNLREALVARRQWEILEHELSWSDAGDLATAVASYAVGAETVRDEKHRDEIVARFREITDAAAQTLLANGIPRWGTPDHPTWRGRLVRFAARRGGRIATGRYLRRPAQ